MKVFSSEIKLSGEDDFSKRFNAVSDLYATWLRLDTEEAFNDYCHAKLCLEQGLPFSIPTNTQNNPTNEQ